MNIDDLLSPYRGFKPIEDEPTEALPMPTPRCDVLRATRIDRGPALPSPEAWEMYEFVSALTA